LELLGHDSNIQIPARMNDGVYLLKQLLAGIATGKIGLSPVIRKVDEDSPPPPPPQGIKNEDE
jgi:hypothetical protein